MTNHLDGCEPPNPVEDGRIDVDVNEQRDPAIELYGLPSTDEVRTFYYDETNNHRFLYLKEDGFNVDDPRPFVLGGVFHPGPRKPIDLGPLRRSMGVQSGALELKFETVAKGDFLRALGSKRLDHFLTWLTAEGYLIHFMMLDPVYFSFVDIIDSMPLSGSFDVFDLMVLKNDLYRVLRSDLRTTQGILRRFNYPAVVGDDVGEFLDELIELVENSDELEDEYHRMMLKGVLQSGRPLTSLLLLDDTPGVILEDYRQTFMHRTCLFKASQHIFDREDRISALLEGYRFVDRGQPCDLYRFVDSRDEPGVQLADVVVGLLGSCLTFLREHDIDEIAAIRRGLTPAQERNRLALADLTNRSISVTSALVQKVLSIDDTLKLETFLDD